MMQNSTLQTSLSEPLRPFKLERFFAEHEFTAKFPMCLSDCEPQKLHEVLAMADKECKDKWQSMDLGYTDANGDPILRQEIANLYETVSADNITVMIPQEAIMVATRAILKAEDHVICVRPAYQSLYEYALSLGCKLSFWDCEPDDSGALQFCVERLKELFEDPPKAVFVNFPHNPTGCSISKEDWKEVIRLCQKSGAILFSDEMYRLLELDEPSRLPAAVDCYDRAISLSGMSKSFGMAGIRLGWLATKSVDLQNRFQQLHDYGSICHVGPAEVLAVIGLRNREKIVGQNLSLIRENLAMATAFFQQHKDLFEFHPPSGSSICFPRIVSGQPIEKFCNWLLQKSGVLLLPGTMYDSRVHADRGHFRLGLGRRSFAEGLKALEFCLAERQSAS